jgi:hypothetical protein
MERLDVIDLPDGRRVTVVYVFLDALVIVAEVGPELIDYEIDENDSKEIGRMTVRPEDLSNRLYEGGKWAADADI